MPPLADSIAALRRHLDEVIGPLWRARGFHAGLGLPHESLDPHGDPLPDTRFRAMACARQLYLFCGLAGEENAGHARRLFDALLRVFYDEREEAWHFSVDAQGRPLDDTQDLYTYAFVVFACAAYFERSRDARALKTLLAVAQSTQTRFHRGGGTYDSVCTLSGERRRGPEQNPVMHLTEAYLAAARVAEPAWFARALRNIAEGVAERFLDPSTQCIMELPLGTADNRIEPGHQFEWHALLASAPVVFEGSDLRRASARGCAWARAAGVSRETGGVCAALDASGAVIDSAQRIWAQTEYARYLAASGDLDALAGQLHHFRQRFLHPRGWREVLGEAGELARADMPSTTPYHLLTCCSDLAALR
jgi:mannose-6-phosphate isomerase